MAIIVRDLLNKNHIATKFCSQTFVASCIVILATFLLPAILVVTTHNYWLATSTYLEQPKVRHINEIMVYIYTTKQTFSFGSTRELNKFTEGTAESGASISPTFEVLNHDYDQDHKADQIDVRITLHTNPRELRNIAITQSLGYSIESVVNADLKLRIFNQFATPNGFTKLRAQGQLLLNQRQNFQLGIIERQIGFEPENELAKLLETRNPMQLLTEDNQQNFTLEYQVLNTYIHDLDDQQSDNQNVQIDLLLDIPKNQKLRFTPNAAELSVKFLMQYIAVLIPIAYIVYELMLGWGFRRHVLRSKITSEIKSAVDFTKRKNMIKTYN